MSCAQCEIFTEIIIIKKIIAIWRCEAMGRMENGMTIDNLEKELNQGNLDSLYLLYGEEEYLLETSVKKIKKLFGEILLGINYICLDETNVNSLIRGDRNTSIWI